MKVVGYNIKRLRLKKGVSLREFAQAVGVSPSFLSQVENGKTTPSLDTLKAIADTLETTIANLMGETPRTTQDVVTRAGKRITTSEIGTGIRINLLTSPDPYKQMEPLYFTLDKDAKSGEELYQHYGQEFLMVLKGTLEVTLNSTMYVLKKGDSMYFNSSTPHSFRNLDKGQTEVIWVITPPSF
jgi:transcriptional regulator with XRE-family HTH domain